MTKAIYMRVSKEDEREQNPEDQLPVILHTFKLKKEDCLLLTERGSAFKDDDQKKRLLFQELKDKVEQGIIKEIYVYKLDRLERNMIRLFEFFFFCEFYGVKIYSSREPVFNMEFPKNAQGNFLKYVNVLMFGTQAQSESENTSERTQKAFKKLKNSTYSKKHGKKIGKKFVNSAGEPVDMSGRKEDEMFDYIVGEIQIAESRGITAYYPLLIEKVKQRYDIVVSPAYLSNIKKRLL